MFYENIKDLSTSVFRRVVGAKRSTFDFMLKILGVQYAVDHKLGGAPSKLCLEDKLLMTLCYWREYRTYLHIGLSYGYSESQTFKIFRFVAVIPYYYYQNSEFLIHKEFAFLKG